MYNVFNYNQYQGIQSDCIDNSFATSNVEISENTCDYNVSSGIYAVRVKNWNINNNTCENNQSGITVEEATQISLKNNTCSDTRTGSARTQSIGIDITAQGDQASQIVASANQCFNNAQSGIAVVTVAGGVISNIQVKGNNLGSNSVYNLVLIADKPSDINVSTVSGNMVAGSASSIRLLD